MKKNKLYFANDDDMAYPIDWHIFKMKEAGINKLDVFKAEVERGTGYFFCRFNQQVGETGNCGKLCIGYDPRNGKSGICKNYGYVYSRGDKKTIQL